METPTALKTTINLPEPAKTSGVRHANGKRTFELHFRKGNRRPESKVFEMDSDLPEAIARARLHCERMDYRFCGCYPFVVDLAMQEASRNDEIHSEFV